MGQIQLLLRDLDGESRAVDEEIKKHGLSHKECSNDCPILADLLNQQYLISNRSIWLWNKWMERRDPNRVPLDGMTVALPKETEEPASEESWLDFYRKIKAAVSKVSAPVKGPFRLSLRFREGRLVRIIPGFTRLRIPRRREIIVRKEIIVEKDGQQQRFESRSDACRVLLGVSYCMSGKALQGRLERIGYKVIR